jgi:hypothetical protein
MLAVFASSAVDCGFHFRSSQTKGYKIGIWCLSAKQAALKSNSKDDFLQIRLMCLCAVTWLPVDCCLSELAL